MSFGTLAICYDDRYQDRVDLSRPTVHLGSAYENNVVLYDGTVAPQHAQIFCDESGYQVLDLDSPQGVYLAGTRLSPRTPVELPPYMPLQLGTVTVVLINPMSSTISGARIYERATITDSTDAGVPFATLFIQYHGGSEEQVTLSQPIVHLGYGYANDVVLYDDGIAAYHAQIQQTTNGYAVVDLGSGFGSLLDGTPLVPRVPTAMTFGSILVLGPVQLRLRPLANDQPVTAQVRHRKYLPIALGAAILFAVVGGSVYVGTRGPASSLPTTTNAAAIVPLPISLPTPTQLPTSMPSATPTSVPSVPSTAPSVLPPPLYIVALPEGQQLNIRSGAGQNAPVIGQLENNTTVRVVEGPIANGEFTWVRIEAAGVTGWCISQALKPR